MSVSSKTVLEIFTDYVCPWCYLASAVVEKIVQNNPDVEVQWTPFPLHPDTPAEGLLLESFLGPNLDAVHERLYTIMDELGLEHGSRTMTYNSRLAQELGVWGDSLESPVKSKALHKELYRAYFVHDKNLAQKSVLLEVVEQAGLDTAIAEQVIDERSFSDQVDKAWKMAREMKISGVPSFVSGGYITTGYHPYDELTKFIEYVEMQQARM